MKIRKRSTALVLGLSFALGALLYGRAIYDGKVALAAGDEALASDQPIEAIRSWRRAARWYAPLAAHVDVAHTRLRELAEDAESKGDVDTALRALRASRTSIHAIRSFYWPMEERLEELNREIARLNAQLEGDRFAGALEKRTEWHYELLARDESPKLVWFAVALLGFGLWVGGCLFFALRGLDREGNLRKVEARLAGALVLGGVLLWMIGLYLA